MSTPPSATGRPPLIDPTTLGSIQSLLDRLVGEDRNDDAIEVEARFGDPQTGVDRRVFARLRDYVIRLNPRVAVTHSRDEFYRQTQPEEPTERFTIVFDRNGHPQQRFRMIKSRIKSFPVPRYFFRVGISREQTDLTPPPSGQPLYTREKKRWSLVISQGRFRLDLTEVTTHWPQAGDPRRTETVYEVELEVLVPKRANLAYFDEAIQTILKELLGTRILYTEEERNNVIASLNLSLGSIGARFGEVDNRVLSQARNLKSRDLVEGGIIPKTNSGVSYTVTIKADGARKLLFINQTGIYLISPPDDVMKLFGPEVAHRLQTWHGTVIEGELIPRENLNPTASDEYRGLAIYFLMYDTLSVSGDHSVRNVSHPERLEYIERLERALSGLALNRGTGRLKLNGMLFVKKPFHQFKNVQEFYRMVQLVLDAEYPYLTDGILFTPDNYRYDASVSRRPLSERRLSQYPDILKWKPRDQLTIDFEIRHGATVNGPLIELLSGVARRDAQRLRALDRVYREEISASPQIDRISFQGSSEYPFDPAIDLLMNDLVQYAPNGTILEFRWTPLEGSRVPDPPGSETLPVTVPESNRGQLEAIRARYDKISPNNIEVALDVWEDIHSPIDLEVIRGSRFGLVFRYHNREKWALFNAIGAGTEKPKVLLDIGSGRGGDVRKWVGAGFTHVICVEPNDANRAELERRLAATTLQARIVPATGQDVAAIVQAVQEFSPTRMVDAITYMLSLSFFFDAPSSLLSIIELTNQTLNIGGYFAAFTVDGRYVRELFQDRRYYTEINNVRRASFDMIDLELRPSGPQVYINIPRSIVPNQIEYLTDLPQLQRSLEEIGLTLVSESRANKERFMTNEELLFSALFSSFLMRRTAQPVRTTLSFENAAALLQSGQIVNFRATPQGVTLVDRSGHEYDIIARYDPATNQILPPRASLTFDQVVQALQRGEITNYRVDPQNQQGVTPGNTRVTLATRSGVEYDAIARYDPVNGQIYTPL